MSDNNSANTADIARPFGQWWDWHGDFARVSLDDLWSFGVAAYERAGASSDDAAFLFGNSLDKSLQGDHARGLVYFPNAIRAAMSRKVDLAAAVNTVREKGATAVVDGGPSASPQLVCRAGMKLAIDKARVHGVGVVAATGGAGLLTAYVSMAVSAGMVGIVLTQTGPCVAPVGGYQPLLGNGPFAVGVPAAKRDPVIVDMCFTQTSASGVLLSAAQALEVPPGLLLDADGNPTTDPTAFAAGAHEGVRSLSITGSLTPLGGGHKGFAMLFVIGLLSSLLSGTSPPWELGRGRDGTFGSVLIAIDPVAMNPDDPSGLVDNFIDEVTNAPRKPNVDEILYPGQRSQQLKRQRREAGYLDLPRPHLESMIELAAEIGLSLPKSFERA